MERIFIFSNRQTYKRKSPKAHSAIHRCNANRFVDRINWNGLMFEGITDIVDLLRQNLFYSMQHYICRLLITFEQFSKIKPRFVGCLLEIHFLSSLLFFFLLLNNMSIKSNELNSEESSISPFSLKIKANARESHWFTRFQWYCFNVWHR